MAFCNNCGAPLPEGNSFCTQCGAKNGEAPKTEPANNPAPVAAPTQAPVQKEKKPVNKKLIIILAAAALALIIVIVVVCVIVNVVKKNAAIKAKTITFKEEYLEVEFGGYDTLGTIDISFSEEFEEDAYVAMGYAKNTTKNKAKEKLRNLKYAIDFEISKTSDLSNGDEVTVKVVVLDDDDSEEAIEDADVILKEKEFTFKVEGLDTVTKYNPFDDLTVTTSGEDGSVYVDWTYTGDKEYISTYDFTCDDKWDLSIGDSYTITVDEYTVDYMLEEYGYLLTETSKTFKVEQADKYITSMDDISEDLLADMQKTALDEITEEYDNWVDDFDYDEWTYEGMYFLDLIDKDSWDDDNKPILVYSATLTHVDGEISPFKVYVGVEFSDAFEYADGTQEVDDWCDMIYEYSYASDDSWDTYEGFKTEKELFLKVYNSNSEDYTITLSDGLTDYSDVAAGYDSVEAFFESEEGITFVEDQEEYLMGLYGDTYSSMEFSASENVIKYEYTYIEEADPELLADAFTADDFEADFEEWVTRTGVEEISINAVFVNPDGTEIYNETFSNF